jgi:hypothetical protein
MGSTTLSQPQSLYTALIRRYGDARKHVTSMACEHKLHLLFAEATPGYAANSRSRTTDVGFRSDTTIALLRRANAKHVKHLVRQPRGRGTADASRSGVKRYGHRHTMKSNNLLFDFPLEVRRATAHSSQQCRIKVVSVAGWQTNKLLPPTHFTHQLFPSVMYDTWTQQCQAGKTQLRQKIMYKIQCTLFARITPIWRVRIMCVKAVTTVRLSKFHHGLMQANNFFSWHNHTPRQVSIPLACRSFFTTSYH